MQPDTHHHAAAATGAPPSAPAQRRALLKSIWLHVRVNLAISFGVAAFLSVLFKGSLLTNLVFSYCIGFSIQALIESGRYGIARWLIKRGQHNTMLREGWPGWPIMGPWVLLSALLGYVVGMQLGGWLLDIPINVLNLGNPRGLFIVLSITLLVSLGFTYHFYSTGQLSNAQAETEAAQRLASEHQLKLLATQLEPHMLFNTLANLRVLIGLDAVRAQAMLDHLIAYLRATLSASRSASHPLSAEFDRLADYLALMSVRMGPRLQVALELPDALRNVPVPPLLLQPLVENAIKHGLEPQVAGGRLAISAQRQGQRLLLQVRDTGVGLDQALSGALPALPPGALPGANGHGFGTAQVRERLQVLYGNAASLTLLPAPDAEGGTLARIELPIDALKPPAP
jgi:hypothetical protein